MTFAEYAKTDEWKNSLKAKQRKLKTNHLVSIVITVFFVILMLVMEFTGALLETETDKIADWVLLVIFGVGFVLASGACFFGGRMARKDFREKQFRQLRGYELFAEEIKCNFYEDGLVNIRLEIDGLKNRKGALEAKNVTKIIFIGAGEEQEFDVSYFGAAPEMAIGFVTEFLNWYSWFYLNRLQESAKSVHTAIVYAGVKGEPPKKRSGGLLYVKNGKMTMLGKQEWKKYHGIGMTF